VTHTRAQHRAHKLDGALRARLSNATFPLTRSAEDEIRRFVSQYAGELRQLGLPPERVLVALKRAAYEAGIDASPLSVPGGLSIGEKSRLMDKIVRWCIAGYYDDRLSGNSRTDENAPARSAIQAE
jgi:hypothetical protein